MQSLKFPPCQGCLVYNRSGLNADSHHPVNPEKKLLFLQKGDFLFHENQRANFFYCIQSGRFILSRRNNDSQEEIMSIVSAGNLPGIDSIVFNKSYKYSAAACQDSVVCKISKKEFLKQCDIHPELFINLLKRSQTEIPVSELIT